MILGRIRLHDGLMVIVRYNGPVSYSGPFFFFVCVPMFSRSLIPTKKRNKYYRATVCLRFALGSSEYHLTGSILVTSSQNLVGRFTHDRLNDTRHYYEGLFSLSKNNTGITSRFPRSWVHSLPHFLDFSIRGAFIYMIVFVFSVYRVQYFGTYIDRFD